jgi:hypothetical protein
MSERISNSTAGTPERQPRTALGKRLWEIRDRIRASGAAELDWVDVEREVAARRGEPTGDGRPADVY